MLFEMTFCRSTETSISRFRMSRFFPKAPAKTMLFVPLPLFSAAFAASSTADFL